MRVIDCELDEVNSSGSEVRSRKTSLLGWRDQEAWQAVYPPYKSLVEWSTTRRIAGCCGNDGGKLYPTEWRRLHELPT